MRVFSSRCPKPNGSTWEQCILSDQLVEVRAIRTILEEDRSEEDDRALESLTEGWSIVVMIESTP